MTDYRKAIEPLEPYQPGRPIAAVKKAYGLAEVTKLASNENPYGASPKASAAAIEAMRSPEFYPDGYCADLREAAAKFYGISPDMFVFGAGTDEVISMIAKVFVNPGDECVTAAVTFGQYAAGVTAMGGVMRYAPMKDDGYDLDAIAALVTGKTKIVFITNPNNPTGTSHTDADQRAFIAKIPESVMIVVDEAYAEFSDDPDYPDTLSQIRERGNIMLLKTFSKAYGLAGLRVGFGIAVPEVIRLFEKIRNPFNVSVPAQAAAAAALSDRKFIESTYRKNIEARNYMYRALDDMGISYIPATANFIMARTGGDSDALFTALMKRGYIVRSGAALGMDGYERISLGTMDQMKGFVQALKSALAER
ncbi:MAG: histidinol-phosphate transaminase [Clostridiales bacterium]|nr:histidinol-phosphate transaminase [Clostridiales bacterium]